MALSVPAYGPTRTFAGNRPVLADRLPRSLTSDAVVVIGIAPVRGLAGQLLYVVLGWIGWSVIHGATGGYLVGFLLATLLIGWQARHGVDRRVDTLAGSSLLATALIYIPGVWWLAHVAHLAYPAAIAAGVAPFILGDLVRALAAGALVPAAWKLVGDREKSW